MDRFELPDDSNYCEECGEFTTDFYLTDDGMEVCQSCWEKRQNDNEG